MWYVVQVSAGREEATLEMMRRFLGEEGMPEAFIPRYQVQKHLRGAWRMVERPLFPGYLFVVTDDVRGLQRELLKVPAFTRILGNDEIFTPLERGEEAWLKDFLNKKDHVVEMSTGVIEGDDVIILDGPLFGQTALIQKIDRRKRIAYLEIKLAGRDVHPKVGLSIVKKTP